MALMNFEFSNNFFSINNFQDCIFIEFIFIFPQKTFPLAASQFSRPNQYKLI